VPQAGRCVLNKSGSCSPNTVRTSAGTVSAVWAKSGLIAASQQARRLTAAHSFANPILIWRTAYTSRDQASTAIGQYTEGFYHPRRRHSSLGYVSPVTFEAKFRTAKKEERMALH
jgi:transposase InsO family protein